MTGMLPHSLRRTLAPILELALYRLVELSSGSIVLDGVDISTIGLTDLRKGLAIIPQEPVSIFFFITVILYFLMLSFFFC